MRKFNIFLLSTAFFMGALLIFLTGCGDGGNSNNRSSSRGKIQVGTRNRPVGPNLGAATTVAPALGADAVAGTGPTQARKNGTGAQIQTPPVQLVANATVTDQLVANRRNGLKTLAVEGLATGTYTLTEVIQILKVNNGQDVMAHRFSLNIDGNNQRSASGIDVLRTARVMKAQDQLFSFPLATQFVVSDKEIKTLSAVTCSSQNLSGKLSLQIADNTNFQLDFRALGSASPQTGRYSTKSSRGIQQTIGFESDAQQSRLLISEETVSEAKPWFTRSIVLIYSRSADTAAATKATPAAAAAAAGPAAQSLAPAVRSSKGGAAEPSAVPTGTPAGQDEVAGPIVEPLDSPTKK